MVCQFSSNSNERPSGSADDRLKNHPFSIGNASRNGGLFLLLNRFQGVTLHHLHLRVSTQWYKSRNFAFQTSAGVLIQNARKHRYNHLNLLGKGRNGHIQCIIVTLLFLDISIHLHVDVSKKRGIPKWMVYNGKPY